MEYFGTDLERGWRIEEFVFVCSCVFEDCKMNCINGACLFLILSLRVCVCVCVCVCVRASV